MPDQPHLRRTRTLKVTEVAISDDECIEIAALYKSSHWQALLNVMERACISIETGLINAPVGNPDEILGAHAVTKAAWLFFQYVQKEVYSSYNRQMQEPAGQEETPLNDLIQGVEGMPMEYEATE